MDTPRPNAHRLRLFLRDFRMVEAHVALAERQSLASWFSTRKSYVNLLDARWDGAGRNARHIALRVEQVLWAAAPDGDVPLLNAPQPVAPFPVEIQTDGGIVIRGGITLGSQQRLSDYLEAAGAFIPLHGAVTLRSGRPPKETNTTLGDVMLNQAGVQAVWEARYIGENAPAE
jgi:hypothetical protein